MDADHDEEVPVKYRKVAEILGSGPPQGQAARNVHRELFFTVGEEPTTFQEAE
jgi:hypothetical protein